MCITVIDLDGYECLQGLLRVFWVNLFWLKSWLCNKLLSRMSGNYMTFAQNGVTKIINIAQQHFIILESFE